MKLSTSKSLRPCDVTRPDSLKAVELNESCVRLRLKRRSVARKKHRDVFSHLNYRQQHASCFHSYWVVGEKDDLPSNSHCLPIERSFFLLCIFKIKRACVTAQMAVLIIKYFKQGYGNKVIGP